MAKTMSKLSTGERLGWVQRRQHSGLLGFGRRLDCGQSGRCEPGELVERGRRRQPALGRVRHTRRRRGRLGLGPLYGPRLLGVEPVRPQLTLQGLRRDVVERGLGRDVGLDLE